MSRSVLFGAFLMAGCLCMVGCNSGSGVKANDMFTVVQEIRTTAATQWEGSYSDGFDLVIPVGTVVQALYATPSSSGYFECKPIMVDKRKDSEYIAARLVPEGVRYREGFLGFTFSLAMSDIGTKLKPLGDE